MPRLWIEYHRDLEPYLDKETFMKEMMSACEVPTVNPALIKARFFCPSFAALGLWQEREGAAYLFVLFEWLEGRSAEIEQLLVDQLRQVLERHVQKAKIHLSRLSVTFEICTIPHAKHHTL